MNETPTPTCDPTPLPAHDVGEPRPQRFFECTDWRAFWLTTGIALVIYLWTLAPEVTLRFSGELATAAKHGGVAHPPGYPIWTLYAWLFTKLLPFSNIAWRVAVSSAVAGALTCGVVALMVSCGGARAVRSSPSFGGLDRTDEKRLRVGCGCVAGLGLGFGGPFWGTAVIVDTWPLSLLLFSTAVCLFMRWMHEPERMRVLYAAVFAFSLATTNSQLLFCAAPGLVVLVMIGQPRLCRDLCLVIALVFTAGLLAHDSVHFHLLARNTTGTNLLRSVFLVVGTASVVQCVCLVARTGTLLTEWKPLLKMGLMAGLGALPYLYLPFASMTNPPMNWGYARTVGGWIHMLARGQYERIAPTVGFERFSEQLEIYGDIVMGDLGPAYMAAAFLFLCVAHKLSSTARNWLLAQVAVFVSVVVLELLVLNPAPDRQSLALVRIVFSAAHLVVAVWAGCGLLVVGSICARPTSR